MSRPAARTRDPDETYRRLLAAALKVFGQHGYAQATVDQIVAAAGYSKGAFYTHFASKEAVVIALLDERVQRNQSRLLEVCPFEGRAAEWVHCLLLRLLSFSQEDRAWPALSVEFMAHGMRDTEIGRHFARIHQEWRQLIVRFLRESEEFRTGRMAASPETVAACVVALLDGFIIQASLEPDQLPTSEVAHWLDPLIIAWFPR